MEIDKHSLLRFIIVIRDLIYGMLNGSIKVTHWGTWRGGVDGSYRMIIDWREDEQTSSKS